MGLAKRTTINFYPTAKKMFRARSTVELHMRRSDELNCNLSRSKLKTDGTCKSILTQWTNLVEKNVELLILSSSYVKCDV